VTTERELPGVGTFVLDDDLGWLVSRESYDVAVLGVSAAFALHDPEADAALVGPAIRRFLDLRPDALGPVAPYVWAYYRDCVAQGWAPDVVIERPDDVWRHVRWPDEIGVVVDEGVAHVELECECDWEPEHGLALVFRDGERISKVGPYDGHLHHLDRREVYPGADAPPASLRSRLARLLPGRPRR
jgi:hypothetical protein